jgi:hypothetical protein
MRLKIFLLPAIMQEVDSVTELYFGKKFYNFLIF